MIPLVRKRLCACGFLAAAMVAALPVQAQKNCVAPGEWFVPGGARIAPQEVLGRAARESVVLLGESHDNADHHRWQLQIVAALSALRPRVVLGFEMFPRRVQGALDHWVAGELSEEEFLKASDWRRVWNHDAQLYLPLFHFARLNRVPMLALNVEQELIRTVRARGFDAVAAEKREGVTGASPASEAYLDKLFRAFLEHAGKGRKSERSDPEFGRFVEAQLVWDRAMAQAIAGALQRDPAALVIGIMGSGHVTRGFGVPRQLESLGVARFASLLPWDAAADCRELSPGLATAVFGMPAASSARPRARLGVTIETIPEGVRVTSVQAGSVAEAAGLRPGDVLVEAAGTPVKLLAELRSIVLSVAPGTWLPLKARRASDTVELLAKFPAAK